MKNQRLTQIHDHTVTVAGPSLRLCLIQATSSPFGQAQGVAQGQGYVGLTTGVTLTFLGPPGGRRWHGCNPSTGSGQAFDRLLAEVNCAVVTNYSVYDWRQLAQMPVAIVDTRHVVS